MANPKHPTRKEMAQVFLSIRMDAEHKNLVVQAAEREGLQLSSFIIMILVRVGILPESCMRKIKRAPVPFFNALHELLGVVNKIGGNCKQLARALKDMDGLARTHSCIIHAAAAITDALHGEPMPEGINPYHLINDITEIGHRFNQIVKSVNTGRPDLVWLPETLSGIGKIADEITSAVTGQPSRPGKKDDLIALDDIDDPNEKALVEMRANMKKAFKHQTSRKK